MWLASGYPQASLSPRLDRIGRWFDPYGKRLLTGVLALHALVAVGAVSMALQAPFSQSKAVADYLRSHHLKNMFLVGDEDCSVATVAGYLDRDIYFARGERLGSFVVWDVGRMARRDYSVLELAKRKAIELHQDVIVILNYRPAVIDASIPNIASFDGAIVADEDYFLYLVRYKGQ